MHEEIHCHSLIDMKYENGKVSLSNPESISAFADKFIVQPRIVLDYLQHLQVLDFRKKKRTDERAKKAKDPNNKLYQDYDWDDLCEQEHRLKDLRVPELNKYLKHHHLNQHMKSGKSDKVRVIINHHRNKGNTEILRTEEYQTCTATTTMTVMMTATNPIVRYCLRRCCAFCFLEKKLKTWRGQQLQDRDETSQQDPR